MTSKKTKHPDPRCYVYITLPGQVTAVTAGRYELQADAERVAVGRFVYGKSYLARKDAVEIDPAELKLAQRFYQTTQHDGVFGALRDAAPDYWGRLVVERALGKDKLPEIEYLLKSRDDRAGALGFGLNEKAPAPNWKFNKTLQLAKLQATALALLKTDRPLTSEEAEQVRRLLLRGTSMGGARPKAVVEDRDGLWLAKFNRPDDDWNVARVEHAMLTLAKACQISAAESRIETVAGKDILLVKRFDRDKAEGGGYFRHRMVSALTLLRSDEGITDRAKWSYVGLAEELRRVSANPKNDTTELFRRMCFNALISNTDDHPRNHAVLARNQHWRLSPAYDLTPSRQVSQEHRDLAMTVGDLGRYASAQNLLSQCKRFLLDTGEAAKTIADMAAKIEKDWRKVATKAGVTAQDREKIKGAFVYPGFSLALQAHA
jgi:serine/threonine-protein kinase HipA